MNDRQIYQLVHQRPRIRATEIAHELGVELLVVSNALRSLVDIGDLVKFKEFDEPTGRQWQVYELSDEFKRSREGKALASLPVTKAEVQDLPEAVVDQLSKPAQALATTPATRQGPKLTKAERCVAFIAKNGQATTDELRVVLELEHKGHVPTYLGTAVRKGELHRDGDLWRLGAKLLDSVESVGKVILANRDATPAELVRQEPEMKPMQSASALSGPTGAPAERPYRCAIWSDGKVEIHKGYQTVILSRAELAEIVAFAADRRAA